MVEAFFFVVYGIMVRFQQSGLRQNGNGEFFRRGICVRDFSKEQVLRHFFTAFAGLCSLAPQITATTDQLDDFAKVFIRNAIVITISHEHQPLPVLGMIRTWLHADHGDPLPVHRELGGEEHACHFVSDLVPPSAIRMGRNATKSEAAGSPLVAWKHHTGQVSHTRFACQFRQHLTK
ncbi:hypothetical protein FE88_26240 [Azospirillum brasilense]|nr:hypothetical protein FE88_26240 [Azospirillum brasilense]QEL89078.1 hypothetical protein D9621_02380 [Azospirillum brasilense]